MVFPSRVLRECLASIGVVSLTFAAVPAGAATDWGEFGIQTLNIDASVRPGDDFAGYVNGLWEKSAEIAPDKTRTGAFIDLDDQSKAQLRTILEESVPAGAPTDDRQRLSMAYRAFMDADAIEAAGLAPARPWLNRIAKARTLDSILHLFASPGFASPIAASVDADRKDSSHYALYLGLGGLGLPDRSHYLETDARHVEIRTRYLAYLTFLLSQAGFKDASVQAGRIMALETAMARAGWDRAIQRNVDLTYNHLTRAELVGLDKTGIMARLLTALGVRVDAANVAQIPPTDAELAAAGLSRNSAAMGGGVPAVLTLIARTPVSTWRAWLTAHFLSDHAQYLPRAIDDANFALYGTLLAGQSVQKPRWRRAIAVVESEIGELLGKEYAARHFPEASRIAMADLVANLRKAMAANLADLAWMGPETRREALAKLAAFTPKIGAPQTFKRYEGLTLSPTAPLANRLAAETWQQDFYLARIGKPVDRSEWEMLPQTVNAYYNPVYNEVVFPAAILQPPFFNPDADPAVNYGAIGAVIGHEMGHGFDDQGSKADGAGNLRNWWTDADKARFSALQDRLAAQIATFCPFDAASGGGKACVNPRLTMGENIGDLGGLSLAWRAYQLSLGGKPAPVIGGFTGDQRFFMAWAQVWRSRAREPFARQMLTIDPHAPERVRINAVVRNFDAWYAAFGVKPGDKLYLPPEERVRIW